MLNSKDFEEIEANALKRFSASFNSDDPLASAVAKIAARVSVIAIHEYHKKLEESEPQ